WKMDSNDGVLIAQLESAIYTLSVSDSYLFVGTQKGVVSVFEWPNLNQIKHLKLTNSPIFEILADDSGYLIVAGDGYVRRLDIQFNLIDAVHVSQTPIRTIIKVPQGYMIGNSLGEIILLSHNLLVQSTLKAHDSTVFTLVYDTNSNKMFSGSKDAGIKMFENGGEVSSVAAHLLHVHRLCINFDGTRLLSSSMDKTIKLWDTNGLKLLKVIDNERHGGHVSSVNKILWIDKNTLISCSDDRTLKCFEIQEK
ncbi:MAG: hypothetical protein IT245_09350, partial [Bacteroidia bacterium]|nr:hypothetical protein [Bacteroidia bacterium]